MENSKNYTLAALFGREFNPDQEAVQRMHEQVKELGGLLHFTVLREEDGWHAQCDEVPAITTGGESPDPSDKEIESSIREAIHVAFDISNKIPSEKLIRPREEREVHTYELAALAA